MALLVLIQVGGNDRDLSLLIMNNGDSTVKDTIARDLSALTTKISDSTMTIMETTTHDLPLLTSVNNSDSTIQNTDTKQDSAKPTLILHMGPPKTATTYLQCILTNLIDILARDNYVYLGMHVHKCRKTKDQAPMFPKSGFFFEEPKMASFRPAFLDELKKAQSQGKNAIIINECFIEFSTEQRQLLIDEFSSNWNVKQILNYRRVYELLPFSYNQNNKPNIYRTDYPSLTLWPGETNEDGVVGKSLLPFNIVEDYIIKNLLLRMEKRGLHQVVEAQQKYPFPDIDVTVIKLHELDRRSSGDAVLKEVFCQVVDNMPDSCAAVQLDETVKIGELENNPYYSFNYDMLATAAYEKQLFGFQKKNTTKMQGQRPSYRREISDLIQRYQEDSLKLTHHDFTQSVWQKRTWIEF